MTTFPHIQDPQWLLLAIALPFLAWRHHRGRNNLGALTFTELPPGSGRAWRLHLPFYLRAIALLLLIAALARPQLGYAWEEGLTEGIDIQVVIDISGSMGAEDFQPRDRLTVAKQVVQDFVAGRAADRIGIVVFSGAAMTRAPLTTDRQMLRFLIDSIQLNALPDGTAIGVALATAAARLKDSQAKSKVIVLVTDGVNNTGAIDPISAAAVCKGLGIKVYTVGVGTAGRVPVPITTRHPITGQPEQRRVLLDVEVDEALLKRISAKTGGNFYKAIDGEQLRQIFQEIDRLETTEMEVKQYVRYREYFQPLVWTALGFLLLPLVTVAGNVTAEP